MNAFSNAILLEILKAPSTELSELACGLSRSSYHCYTKSFLRAVFLRSPKECQCQA
jgi:hypothetical protein